MTIKGIDYAFSPHPDVAAMVRAGVRWVGRYVSPVAVNDSNGKNLLAGECSALLGAQLEIVLFAEQSAGRMLGGHAAGVADAQHFDKVVHALHMAGAVMYCCADFDATPAQQAPINAYLDGAASVIGRTRTGIYGSFYVVKRTLDAGKAKYACQTVAWSGGQWDGRAHIRQHLQIRVGGVSVDFDEALRTDFGQWPRHIAKPEPAPSTPVVKVAPGGVSLRKLLHADSTTVARGVFLMAQQHAGGTNFGAGQAAYIAAGDWDAPLTRGVRYVVG